MRNKHLGGLAAIWLAAMSFLTACGPVGPATTTTPTAQPPTPEFTTPTPAPTPTAQARPGINITKEQYWDARAKWDAQRVEEYEMTINHRAGQAYSVSVAASLNITSPTSTIGPGFPEMGDYLHALPAGTWRLHVLQGRVYDTSFTPPNNSAPVTPSLTPGMLDALTIEHQFAFIEYLLFGGPFTEQELMFDWQVKFNPEIGYPMLLARTSDRITDSDTRTEVTELTVLQGGAGTPEPTPTEAPFINITREQYEQALATWKSQGAEEYEVTVTYGAFSLWSGVWTLKVSPDSVEALSFSRGDPAEPTAIPQADQSFLRMLTVEGQFEDIKRAMDNPEESPTTWTVEFHPTQGYPTSVIARDKPYIADAGYSWSAQELKITKTGTPIVP
jgi:Family of unknown function (DUF6174)